MRYVEIDGKLRKFLTVIKMRGGPHSNDLREYTITSKGIVMGKRMEEYAHLITGIPDRIRSTTAAALVKPEAGSEGINANGDDT